MMHPHSIHQHHQGHHSQPGPPPQHLGHGHNHSHPAMTHHQMPPHHRDQNRLLGGGQGGGSGMGLGMGGMGPTPPRPILSAIPPIVHHHRPPPRHIMTHSSAPPVTIHQRPDRHDRGQAYNSNQLAAKNKTNQASGVLMMVGPNANTGEKENQAKPTSSSQTITQNSASLSDAAKLLPPNNILPSDIGNSNSKEKTPMCLINELARFNKIQHQYRLTSEQGPAHRKRFTVSLRLGGEVDQATGETVNGEEYSAEGFRIRLAQHAVAAEALRQTHYPSPPPRPPRTQRNKRSDSLTTIMPTVELNALTMKLGLTAVYTQETPIIPDQMRNGSNSFRPGAMPIRPPPPNMHHIPSFNRNQRVYQRFMNHFGKYPPNPYKDQQFSYPPSMGTMHSVKLTVGTNIFKGEGATPQAARHDAASKALKDLKDSKEDDVCDETDGPEEDDEDTCDVKSPVSMVHEIALKFNLPVNFEVKSEKGPPHMKLFLTICTVAEHVTEGEGNSKKVSKKKAAEKMLKELKKLPSVKKTVIQPDVKKSKKKQQQPKKRSRSLIKEKTDSGGSETNPVSRLLQWATSGEGGGQEPVYTLEEEIRGSWRERPHFSMKCEVAAHTSKGTGASKKIAKRAAAEAMLIMLGLGKTPSPSSKTSSKNDVNIETNKNARKVTFNSEKTNSNNSNDNVTSTVGGSSGRQLVPGLLLMQDHSVNTGTHFNTPTKNGFNAQTTATIAKELLNAGTSPTADALAKLDKNQRLGGGPNTKPVSSSVVSSTTGNTPKTSQSSQVIRPKDQLLYLAQLLGFEVQFSDFKKGSHGEFLSLVSLSTEPPMVCHGGGVSIEKSHDQSAHEALERLSQMGLDNVTPHTNSKQNNDGVYVNGNDKTITDMMTNGLNNQ